MQTHEEETEAPAEDAMPLETEMEAVGEPEVPAQTGDRVSPVEEPSAVTEAEVEPAEVEAANDVVQPEPVIEVVPVGDVPEEEAEMEVLAAEEAAEVPAENTELITQSEVLLPLHNPPFAQLHRTPGTNRCFVFSRMLLLTLWNSKWWVCSTCSVLIQAKAHLRMKSARVLLLNANRLLHRQVAGAPVEETEAPVAELKEVKSQIWKHCHICEIFTSHRCEELQAVGSSAGFLSLLGSSFCRNIEHIVSEFAMRSFSVQNSVISVLVLRFSNLSINQEIVDNLADDYVVTETAEAVEVAIAESASQPVGDRPFLICK